MALGLLPARLNFATGRVLDQAKLVLLMLPSTGRALLRSTAVGVLLLGCRGAPPSVLGRSHDRVLDAFGVRELYAGAGRIWLSKWNGPARSFGSIVDPGDPEFDADHGEASYEAAGGVLAVSGMVPRMYIHDPAHALAWRNVEVTTYAQRIDDSNIAWGGIMAYARTNHGTVGDEDRNICDDRGYGGMLTHRGAVKLEKEVNHCADERGGHGYAQALEKQRYAGGLPKGRWIGYKLVVRDQDRGNKVRLELWLDETDGAGGGAWEKVLELVDDGTAFGKNDCDGHPCDPCAPGIDPALALTSSDDRPGSESHRPNATVYFRSDGVGPRGLLYKKMSVREIEPLP